MARAGSRVGRLWVGLALTWLHVCLLFALVNAGAWIALRCARIEREPPGFVSEALARVFPDLPPAARTALWREHTIALEEDPLVLFREPARSGRFVTVHPDGFRVGPDPGPWPPDPGAFNVFLFGGSTTFGYGVPDEHTVPAYVQRLLTGADRGEVHVYNFGRGGYVSSHERLLFEKLAMMGHAIDLAVFLDGINDFSDAVHPTFLTRVLTRHTQDALDAPVLAALRALPFLRLFRPGPFHIALEREIEAAQERPPPDGPARGEDAWIDEVIQHYLANLAATEAVAALHGVEPFFVWQPAPTYKYDLSYHTYPEADLGLVEVTRRGYPRMRAYVDAHPPGDRFLWCADVQEGVRETLYVDRVHYAPHLAERVAACIVDGLRARGRVP